MSEVAEDRSLADIWQAAEAKATAAEPTEEAVEETPAPEETPEEEGAEDDSEKSEEEASDEKEESSEEEEEREPEVSAKERIKLRQWRRKKKAEIEEYARRQEAEVKEAWEKLHKEYGPIASAKKALEAEDYDAFAKELGHDDWTALNKHILRSHASPEYKRIRELEQREMKREQEAAERRKEAEQRALAEQQAREQAAYQAEIAEEMKSHADRAVQAFAVDSQMVEAVFAVQQAHWDGEETLSVEEAMRAPLSDGTTLLGRAKDKYKLLASVFADDEGAEEQTVSSSATKAKKQIIKNATRRRAAEVSGTGTQSSEAFMKKWTKKLSESTPSG